ncbi:MAG: FAD-binding oxidoreductase [Candidatus Binataceae bacterium]|nr:FAD-binding oxidoreductase [Candidatus Binataceae bacterium]
MAKQTIANRTKTAVGGAERIDLRSIRNFAASLSGDVIVPGDHRYSQARRVWNHAVNVHPAIIARCANTQDVVRTVEFARRYGLLTALRSGGHSFAGHAVCEGGMVIDLSSMKRSWIDPLRKFITIETGVIAGELDCLTQAFKLAIPLGSCPSVGVAGYSLGGGEGSLTPNFGYGCDSITRLEVVTADSRVQVASAQENTDLFWAMRGAGANFGVATSIEFQLHPVETVLSGHLKYPLRQAKRILRFLAEYAPAIPNELFLIAAVLPYPGDRMLDVAVVWSGKEKAGERVLRPLRTFLKPFEDSIKVNPYLEEQRSGTGTPAEGDYSSHRKSGHFDQLTADVIDVIADYTHSAPSEASGISIIYWHGPWCSGSHDNAFGFRRTGFEYWIHTYWKKSGERKRSWEWVEQFYAAMKPLSTGAVYVNGLEDEGDERVVSSYGSKYARLTGIKREYDPDNFFRVNQNIKPAP